MDFPVCPSCGQSVIDDDAEDCPFCGSSMKAKPGAKPAPKAAAAPAKGAAKPASAGAKPAAPAAKGAAAKPATAGGAGDDFPFDTDVPSAKTAIQAMPNPSKGRTLQVVCPMCETEGYVPPTAAGKEVKCANTKCMVPVFKAKAATVEAPPPPPPKKSNLVMLIGITVVVMALIGVGAVFGPGLMSGNSKPVKQGLTEEQKRELQAMAAGNTVTPAVPDGDGKVEKTTTPEKTTTDAVVPKSPDDYVAAAIKQLNDSSLIGDRRQRSKAFCRQLAADACARTGDVKAANENLAQLIVVGRTVPYYRIEPNLVLFWNAWGANDKAAATRALDAAVADAPGLQKVGRYQLLVASRLAAALVVADRVKEAQAILEAHQSSDRNGQLAARVQRASDGQILRVSRSDSVLPWNNPQAVATTMSLVTHGQFAAGKTWALAQSDETSRAECLTVWAEGVAFSQDKPGPASSNPEIAEAIKGLSPAQQARVWARAACGRFAAGDSAGAAATLNDAQALIASVPVPPEPEMPTVKAAVTYKLPAATPLIQAATAASEIAFAHSLWPDHKKQAEDALDTALAFVRGLAPAWSAVAPKSEQAEQAGAAGLRDLIKKELALKSDDLANQNVSKYRKVISDLSDASQRRISLQETILSRLIEVGLKDKAWLIVSTRSAESDANRRDDFLKSTLMGDLVEAFQGTETEKEILGALNGANPDWPDVGVVRHLLKEQNVAEAAQYVSKLDASSGRRDEVALLVATSLAAAGKTDASLGFIGKLEDIVLREEAYQLCAALLAQRGQAEAVWTQVEAATQATERAALCKGLVAGLKGGAPQKQLPDPAVGS